MVSLADHTSLVAMHKRGSSVSEISKTLKLHREQAYRVRSRFWEISGIRTARTPAFRDAVKSSEPKS
ncbi:hypothetical protein Y032_0038g3643 [Ancylostoma ceylanicum]|uniref:Tc3 transposase DNA binding domain-containing protein n=1 Tax=Ancylostoma ceylanicum TaxID=53326 RepID=A0A016UJW7_9BILA|nr:hypothetical protein Y032_0038g3643 [Ancylostoma ceylanicum]